MLDTGNFQEDNQDNSVYRSATQENAGTGRIDEAQRHNLEFGRHESFENYYVRHFFYYWLELC